MLHTFKELQICIFLIGITFLFVGCNTTTDNENIIANIEGVYEISFFELNKHYKNNRFDRLYPDDAIKGYREALNDLIVRRQKETDFVNLGLQNDTELMQDIKRVINEEIVVEYFNNEFLSKYINEKSIQNYYDELGREVTYSLITFNKNKYPKSELDSLRAVVNDIRDQLEDNANFGELAKAHSDHKPSAANGGRMPAIDWRKSVQSQLNQTIFNLPMGGVQVLENSRRYFIIKIEDVKQVEIEPLENIRRDIVESMRQLYLDRSLEEFVEVKENLVNEATFSWNDDALERVLEWGKRDNFYTSHYEQKLLSEIEEGNNSTLLTYESGEVDLEKLLQLLNEILIPGKSENLSKDELKNFISEAIKSEMIVNIAKEEGYNEKLLLTKNSSSDAIRYEFLRLYNQVELNSKLPEPTEENLRKFYDAHKDSLLYQHALVSLYVKEYNTEEEANELLSKINQLNSFEEATNRRYKIKTFIKDKDGVIDSHLSREKPYLGKVAYEFDEGEIRGPIKYTDENNNTYYVVAKCNIRVEEKVPEFHEIKNIEKRFRDYHRDSLSTSVRKKLAQKYPAVIYDDVLEQKVSALVNR